MTQAALDAGYSPRTAAQAGKKNLNKPEIFQNRKNVCLELMNSSVLRFGKRLDVGDKRGGAAVSDIDDIYTRACTRQ